MNHFLRLSAFLMILSCCCNAKVSAQNLSQGDEIVYFNDESKLPAYFKFRQNDRMHEDMLFGWLNTRFQLQNELTFRFVKSESDQLGMVHQRYQQQYKDVPIEFSMYILHIRDHQVISFNGVAFDKIKTTNQVILSEQQALETALSFVDASVYKWQISGEEELLKAFYNDPDASYYPKGELVLINPSNDFKSPLLRYAYKFNIYADQPLSRAEYYIDAQDGRILFVNTKIQVTDVPAKGESKFSGTVNMTSDSVSATVFRLRETGRGNGIETYNLKNGTNYNNAVDFNDSDNYWNNFNAAKDEIATDAHWATEMTYDYYKNVHGRNSIDANGFKLKSYLHYSTNYANAFWNGQWMTYGDGNTSTNPFVSIDIISHEITHGLTSYTADLVYSGESGALNEGFSDIFGNMVEFYAKPGESSWEMGEDIGYVIRDMKNPNARGNPDTYGGTNWMETIGCVPTSQNDNCGVHKNSTVNSHWFYLLAMGGSGTNDKGEVYHVNALGIEKASQIAFRSLTVYLPAPSDFIDARFYSSIAAVDLFGECSDEVTQVLKAWYAVGVGQDGQSADFEADKYISCSKPFNVQFSNLSDAYATFRWDFGDGDTSADLSPVHTYNSYGKFDVTLIAVSKCKTDTVVKKAYIQVDTTLPCIYTMSRSGITDTTFNCRGTLLDDGGDDDYTGNQDAVFVIAPPGADKITLEFLSFAMEGDCDCDWLYVYDGTGTNSPLIGKYSGFNLPNGGIITSSGGAITIRQYTDPLQTYSGFELNWYCSSPNSPPSAAFKADAVNSCKGEVQFSSLSSSYPTAWKWYFGDGHTSDVENPAHNYSYSGFYDVALVVSNAYGKDSLVKTKYVLIERPMPPVVDPMSSCGPDSFVLTANASGTVFWYAQEDDSIPLFQGDTFNVGLVTETKSYFVEDDLSFEKYFVGPKDSAIGAGSYFTGTQSMIFDVYSKARLKSVKVYASSTAQRTIQILTKDGLLLMEKKLTIPKGESRVLLNFDLPVLNELRITANAGSNLFRNSTGAFYSYVLENIISITGSTASEQAYYYYFYDWEIEIPCVSARKEVEIRIDTMPVADFKASINGLSVAFTDLSSGAKEYIWAFGDGDSSTEQNPVHIYPRDGNYYAMLLVKNSCGYSDTFKNVLITGSFPEFDGTKSVNIYPVPARESIYLQFNGTMKGMVHFNLFNALGKQVLSKEIYLQNKSQIEKIDIGRVPGGVYFIQLLNSTESIVHQILIE